MLLRDVILTMSLCVAHHFCLCSNSGCTVLVNRIQTEKKMKSDENIRSTFLYFILITYYIRL